jgi:hypothetical protein
MALGFLALGCGSSGSGGGSSDPAAAFAGTWTFGSGSIQPMCNLNIPAFDLTGDTMKVTSTDATHVATMLTGSGVMCDVNFTVNGDTATAEANQTCVVTTTITLLGTPMSLAVNIDINTWTLSVSGDMLTIAMTGSASAEQGAVNCSPTADGTATRSSDGGAGG